MNIHAGGWGYYTPLSLCPFDNNLYFSQLIMVPCRLEPVAVAGRWCEYGRSNLDNRTPARMEQEYMLKGSIIMSTKRGPIEPMTTDNSIAIPEYGQVATVREFHYHNATLQEAAQAMVSTLNKTARDLVLAQQTVCRLLGDVERNKSYQGDGFKSLSKFAQEVLDKTPAMGSLYARVATRFFVKQRLEYPPTLGDFIYITPVSCLNELTQLTDDNLSEGLSDGRLKAGMSLKALREYRESVKPPKPRVISKENASTKGTDGRDMTDEQQFDRLVQETVKPVRLSIKVSWLDGVKVLSNVLPADVGTMLKEAAPDGAMWDFVKEVERGVWAAMLVKGDTLYSMLCTVEDEEDAKAKAEAKEAERKALEALKAMFPDKSTEELKAIMAVVKTA